MADSCDIERRMRQLLLNPEDEDLLAELQEIFEDADERDKKISDTLDELLKEVDELILMVDQLEEEENCEG